MCQLEMRKRSQLTGGGMPMHQVGRGRGRWSCVVLSACFWRWGRRANRLILLNGWSELREDIANQCRAILHRWSILRAQGTAVRVVLQRPLD